MQNRGVAAASTRTVRRSLVLMLAGLSAGAGAIHLIAAPPHFAEIGDLAAGFMVAAAFQLAWIPACLAGPSRRATLVACLVNLGVVAAWALTRTVGLPAGSPEPVGLPDGASVVFEVLLIAGLLAHRLDLDLAVSRRPMSRTLASVAVVPVIGLVILVSALSAVAIATGQDHGAAADAHADAGHAADQGGPLLP